ncbi:MAG: transglutaminase domain-containing protein [Pseudanabaenaceae cyanobacterium]
MLPIYPYPAYSLRGLAWYQGKAVCVDSYRGYLLVIDPQTESTMVINQLTTREFVDVTDLAITEQTVWVVRGRQINYCQWGDFSLQLYLELPEIVEGITVSEGGVYVSCSRKGEILVFGRSTRNLLRRMPAPGQGEEKLTLRGQELWVADSLEETIYCLDTKTGYIRHRALTPYPHPQGLDFHKDRLYVLQSGKEFYIRDNPNDPRHPDIGERDKSFIYPQVIIPQGKYTLSNGYLVEMTYVEEILPEEPKTIDNLTWKIALPATTPRQKLRSVSFMGHPFQTETLEDQKVAVFQLGKLLPQQRFCFGWKAVLELRGIKYEIDTTQLESQPIPPELQARYLVDDDDLSMDHPIVQEAAREAVGDAQDMVTKMLNIRNYVYDRLEYRMESFDSPDVVLRRGYGSCGEYVGVLLALARLNGIPCRTVGRYKCPQFLEHKGVVLHQYYNHVWLEFYLPGYGWVPLESNPDDTGRPPYPTRFFMGLPWYHVELGKGIPFETIDPGELSIGSLAINHIRFRILGELD